MNTEITDTNARAPTGWVYFDAGCRFCVAHRNHWGKFLERRGFVWLSLQTPGVAERLGVTQAQLRAEMWLQYADGQKFSGVNAWSALMRRVWWLWPLGVLLALPGFNAAGHALYRSIARRRHCLGRACSLPLHSHNTPPPSTNGNPHRHSAFFEFP